MKSTWIRLQWKQNFPELYILDKGHLRVRKAGWHRHEIIICKMKMSHLAFPHTSIQPSIPIWKKPNTSHTHLMYCKGWSKYHHHHTRHDQKQVQTINYIYIIHTHNSLSLSLCPYSCSWLSMCSHLGQRHMSHHQYIWMQVICLFCFVDHIEISQTMLHLAMLFGTIGSPWMIMGAINNFVP